MFLLWQVATSGDWRNPGFELYAILLALSVIQRSKDDNFIIFSDSHVTSASIKWF